MQGEEEWIESPDGWGKGDNVLDDDDEANGACDLFADQDPTDCFEFDIVQAAENDTEERWGASESAVASTKKKTIELKGFKLESDETAQSTGVTLWQAAPRLATFIMKSEASNDMIVGQKVLELGAGLGLCGIVAHHLGAIQVILTDGDTQTLQNMRENVSRNRCSEIDRKVKVEEEAAIMHTIDCRQLIWGSLAHIDLHQQTYGSFDTILGADIIYTIESMNPLFDTVVALMNKPHGRFILSRYTRWNSVSDEAVLQAAQERGLFATQPDEGIYVFHFQDSEETEDRINVRRDRPDVLEDIKHTFC